MKEEDLFNKWLEDLPTYHKKSVLYILNKFKNFPGRIAVIGSSVSKKYPSLLHMLRPTTVWAHKH